MSVVTRILPLVVLAPIPSSHHSLFNPFDASDTECNSLIPSSTRCPYSRRNCASLKQLESLIEKPITNESSLDLVRARAMFARALMNLHQAIRALKVAHIKAGIDRTEADAPTTTSESTEQMPSSTSKWAPRIRELLDAYKATPKSAENIAGDEITETSNPVNDIDPALITVNIDWDKVRGVDMEVDGVHKWLDLSDDQKNELKGINAAELTDKLLHAYEQAQGLSPSSTRDFKDVAYTIRS